MHLVVKHAKAFAKSVVERFERLICLKVTTPDSITDVLDYFGRDTNQWDGSVVEWRSLVALLKNCSLPVRKLFGMMPMVISLKK